MNAVLRAQPSEPAKGVVQIPSDSQTVLNLELLEMTNFISDIRDVLNDHLEGVETELDWLQQQLTAGGLNIDNNTLFSVGVELSSYYFELLIDAADSL